MACDCIMKINEKIRDHNTRIQVQFSTNSQSQDVICTPCIGTEKIDQKVRKRAMGVVPTFCPFCGVKYRANEPKKEGPATMADAYLIWSNEHRAWWRPNSAGYTIQVADAGRYSLGEALSICRTARDGWRHGEVPPEVPIREEDALTLLEIANG